MTFRVLGPLEVVGPDDRPIEVAGGKPAIMFTLLLLHRNTWVSTDQLIDALWERQELPTSAQRNLKTYVWQLRRILPGDRIESRPGSYRVRVLPGELDADLAADLSVEARRLLVEGTDPARAAELIGRALELWRGDAYDGLAGGAGSAVERLTELHRSLREDLADAALALGRPADAIATLRVLTEEEPLREVAWTKLMAAFLQTGRRHDALATYQRARGVLVRELGIEPGAELTQLHQEILNDTPKNTEETGGRSDLPCRIAGFAGRTAELDRLAALANDAAAGVGVVTIDGMPGIGKTALALEAAHQVTNSYPDGRFYLDLRSHRDDPVGTAQALRKLIRSFRGPAVRLPDTVDELAAYWRSTLRGQRILLVLDDVADAEQVGRLLPGTAGSLVLVTSRTRLPGLNRTGSISLDVLPDEIAEELADPAVLRWCGGHPAAIRQLTDRLRDRQPWTAKRMVSRLEDPTARRRELSDVLALFDATYASLPPEVQQCYRLLGLMPVFDVRRAAGLLGISQVEVEPILDELLDHHLVTEPGPGRFALHPLVRDHANQILLATESEAELRAAAQRADIQGAGLELVSSRGPRVA
jgi:DNA-binding SARP family transcriptional activator